MPIKNYTTKVPAVQTVGEIQGILAAHGARKVMMDYAENGRVTAVTFALDCCGRPSVLHHQPPSPSISWPFWNTS